MKRKIFLLLAIVLTITLLATACVPKNISEDEAEKTALAALNKTFDISLTKASVVLMQHPQTKLENDKIVNSKPEKWVEYYSVSVNGEKGGTLYLAEVDAKTSAVGYITRSADLVVPTSEQAQKAASIGTFKEYSADRFTAEQKDAGNVAVKWVQEVMEPESELHHATTQDIYTDKDLFPTLIMETMVVMQSGNAYQVTVCWPAMQIVGVQILHLKS